EQFAPAVGEERMSGTAEQRHVRPTLAKRTRRQGRGRRDGRGIAHRNVACIADEADDHIRHELLVAERRPSPPSHPPRCLRCSFGEADTAACGESVSGYTVEPPDAGDTRRSGNPKGRLKKPTGCVAVLVRCPTSPGARLLPCRLLEPAQAP